VRWEGKLGAVLQTWFRCQAIVSFSFQKKKGNCEFVMLDGLILSAGCCIAAFMDAKLE
jgi:hypothetical protein